jgi:hypothetical protein
VRPPPPSLPGLQGRTTYLRHPKSECRRSPLVSIAPSIWSVSRLSTKIGTRGSCSSYAARRFQSRSHEKGPTCQCARGAASRNRLSSSTSDDLSYSINESCSQVLIQSPLICNETAYSQLGSINGNNKSIKHFTLSCATPRTSRMALLATPTSSQTRVQLYEVVVLNNVETDQQA